MSKTSKVILWVLGGLLLISIVGYFVARTVLKNKFETFVNQGLPENITANYQFLQLDLWNGSAHLLNPNFVIRNSTSGEVHTNISADTLQLHKLDYWEYFFSNKIILKQLTLNHPVVLYHPHKKASKTDTTTAGSPGNFKKQLLLDRFKIRDASLTVYDKTEDSVSVHTPSLDLELNNIRLDSASLQSAIPFRYGSYSLRADSIFAKTSQYENITAGKATIEHRNLLLEKVRLKTKYGRERHAQLLKRERDHFNLEIDQVALQAIDFGFRDSQFFFSSQKLHLQSPFLYIFRNKLVADDPSTKPLYSKMLRELPFQLTIDSAAITQANIQYTEKVKEGTHGGTITFSDFNASIARLSNTYGADEETTIDIKAQFMDEAPFQVTWSFDVNDKSDAFTFRADVGHLNASELNKFTEPNLLVRLRGDAQQTYFTIDGHNTVSHVDFRMKFDQFKVKVMEKNENEKNWLISTFANLLLANNSNGSDNDFKDGSAKVQRVTNKSIFNFLWLNVRAGLKAILL